MGTVVITGADSALGRRVAALVERDPAAVAVALGAGDRPVDLARDDVKPHLEGADVLVHLAVTRPATPTAATDDVEAARRTFDAAGAAGVRHLVVLSSATVYGAWANNPVPLTEDAPLRPNPGVPFAAERAEIERLAAEWRDTHPGTTVAVLRPVRTVAPDDRDWLVPALRPAPAAPAEAEDPPAQYLHLDDLAAAVDLARTARLDGAFNVAPPGSIPGEAVRALIGAPPKVPLPGRVAGRAVRWGWRSGLGATPPELVPYVLQPWVVASDRLRARGWSASVSNEEACVDAHEVSPWASLSPRRRQELALAVAGVGLAGALAAAGVVVRRAVRRR
ncbi:MAG: NAD-dependent epimerase/dehydratase family protein [Acidimicrobiia bacterium]